MLNRIALKNTGLVINIHEKTRDALKAINGFKEKHKALLMKCATVYMSVKIGLILLATLSTVAFLIISVSQHLAIEMSKTKALIFAIPLTLIIMLKLYFIFKMLMAYDRSRAIINSAVNVIILNGKQEVQRIGEAVPVGLSRRSLEKIKNR